MITIGVVDDKSVNRRTVSQNFAALNDISVVLEAGNGSDFLQKMNALPEEKRPDVVLMDIDMPVMNGIEAIAIGTIRFPKTRFLVLTVFDDDEKIFEAIQAGASGYLLKDDTAIQLADAIREVSAYNAVPMSPSIARKTLNWLKTFYKPSSPEELPEHVLTEREIQIIKLMVEGNEYRQIAARLFISPNTVRAHIGNIYEKLHINSKAQAVQLAYKFGWIK
jgi:DNA-binding NarL/FixJ family response regulator